MSLLRRMLVLLIILCAFPARAADPTPVETSIDVEFSPSDLAYDSGSGRVFVAGAGLLAIDAATNEVVVPRSIPYSYKGIAIDSVSKRVYATTGGSLHVLDPATLEPTSMVNLNTSGAVAVDVSEVRKRAYVVADSNLLVAVDTVSSTRVGQRAVGQDPEDVAVDDARGLVYVSNYLSSTISVIDADSLALVRTVDVSFGPTALVFDETSGLLYVAMTRGGRVHAIDPATGVIVNSYDTLQCCPRYIALDSSRNLLYVAGSGQSVRVVDLATGALSSIVTVCGSPGPLAVAPEQSRVFIGRSEEGSIAVLSQTATFPPDTTPPATRVNSYPGETPVVVGDTAWLRTSWWISFTCKDDRVGCGYSNVKEKGVLVPGQAWSSSEEGLHTLEYWSVDCLGNTQAPQRVNVGIDRSSPLVDMAPPVPIFPGTAVLNAQATDSLSGIQGVCFNVYRVAPLSGARTFINCFEASIVALGRWQATINTLPTGWYDVKPMARDWLEHEATTSVYRTFFVMDPAA